MKRLLLLSALLILTVATFGQTQLFKNYDFSKGGYSILGALSVSDRNALCDSLGEFYTDDMAILNKFKKDWIVKKPGMKYSCGYHYTLSVCLQGKAIESFSINLNCKEIVTNAGYFYFDPNLLRQFYGKLKKPQHQQDTFLTITQARTHRANILKDAALIMAPKPFWTEYEGRFGFTYPCPDSVDCHDDEPVIKAIDLVMKAKYPGEKFILNYGGGTYGATGTTLEIGVSSNQSLSDKFDLYPRDRESYRGKWRPYDLTLETYWRAKKE